MYFVIYIKITLNHSKPGFQIGLSVLRFKIVVTVINKKNKKGRFVHFLNISPLYLEESKSRQQNVRGSLHTTKVSVRHAFLQNLPPKKFDLTFRVSFENCAFVFFFVFFIIYLKTVHWTWWVERPRLWFHKWLYYVTSVRSESAVTQLLH